MQSISTALSTRSCILQHTPASRHRLAPIGHNYESRRRKTPPLLKQQGDRF